ncbi:hypothetical protein P5G51_014995 [Virgibacillus sp. 179-BFC.A HS]|uniref:Alpha-L-arabinofuranosidase n=1 Tax=Tigheibacillus jepli TaxID=3035914 RepID=A0ABU5CM09_9BACI|nr:hypothetical protein [Virgibacillus sp. 179-BFC.A HS]MDY0406495.1 hypothetical protein [Virgibacillus sp. 179-BFC.A HS]
MKVKKKQIVLISITVLLLSLILVGFSSNALAGKNSDKNNSTKRNPNGNSKVMVFPNKEIGEINKEIYGVHVPAWNETIYDHGKLNSKLKHQLNKLNLGFLVYPGGNFGSNFIWNDPNLPTEMNTDQFLKLNDQLGTTAKISVNPMESPKLAADWVDYVNNEKNADVKYWEIADEPYLTMKTEDFIQTVKEFAPAMKKADPNIKIIANVSALDSDFTKTVIKEVGNLIDVYSIHSLPLPPSQKFNSSSPYTEDNKQAFFDDLLKTPNTLRDEIDRVKSWVKEYQGNKNVEYHIGSFSTVWSYPEDWTVNSLPAGLWTADMLGTFAEKKIDAAAYWALMNPYPPGNGDYGLISPEMKPYVNYYAFELYGNHFGDTMIETKQKDDSISTYASTSENGKNLYLVVVNKSSTKDKEIQFDLKNFKPRGDAAAWILDGPTVPDHVYDYGLRKESIKNIKKNGKFTWTVPSYSAVAIEIPSKKVSFLLKIVQI